MNRNIIGLLMVLLICDAQILSAQAIPRPDDIVNKTTPQDLPNTADNPEKESDLRRAEIIFLISLPFTAILSFLAVTGGYYISNPSALSKPFYMPDLPPQILPFSIFTAVFSSAMITYNDYWVVHQKEIEAGTQKDIINSQKLQMGINIEKKF